MMGVLASVIVTLFVVEVWCCDRKHSDHGVQVVLPQHLTQRSKDGGPVPTPRAALQESQYRGGRLDLILQFVDSICFCYFRLADGKKSIEFHFM